MSSNEESLDPQERAHARQRMGIRKQEHEEYLRTHPEVQQLLGDFVSACLLEKPTDVFDFASRYFSTFMGGTHGPTPLVVVGPSGVGKGTLLERMQGEYEGKFGFSVSHTTRPPRPGEVDGREYTFTDRATMNAQIQEGKFIETAEFSGNLYGTSFDAVKRISDQGVICILEIDLQGARQLKETDLESKFLFVMPPSLEELERRLRGRATESEASIKQRLRTARIEIEGGKEPGFFDATITNDDLDQAYADLKRVVELWYPHLKA